MMKYEICRKLCEIPKKFLNKFYKKSTFHISVEKLQKIQVRTSLKYLRFLC